VGQVNKPAADPQIGPPQPAASHVFSHRGQAATVKSSLIEVLFFMTEVPKAVKHRYATGKPCSL
jgi:hypothetical protein